MCLNLNVIDLHLTGKCNYNCEYCYGEDEKYSHMSKEIINHSLSFIKEAQIETLDICGGEPLISPLFTYVVEEAKKLGLKLILRTNSIYLEKYIDLVVDNFEWVGISLDGTKEINHIMRPDKNLKLTADEKFNTVINNIKKLKQLNPKLKILLASVATNVNYENLIELFDYLTSHQIPIDEWKIYQFMTTQYRSLNSKDKFFLADEKFDYLKKELKNKSTHFDLIFREANKNRAGNDALMIGSNGNIKVVSKSFGQIGKNSNKEIIENIKNSDYLNFIINNKKETYGGNDE